MCKVKEKHKKWITGFTVGQCFGIREKSLVKLRKELIKTEYIIVPEDKKVKVTSNFWYNLDYLLTRFKPIKNVPSHLIR